MVKTITVNKKTNDKDIIKFKGDYITNLKDYDLYDKSINIKKENGDFLVIYRKKAVPSKFKKTIIENTKYTVEKPTTNRGMISGVFDEKLYKKMTGRKAIKRSKFTGIPILNNGKKSKQVVTMPSYSNIMGWFDYKKGKTKQIFKVKTATIRSQKNFEKFQKLFPFVEWVTKKYKYFLPKLYNEMYCKAKKIQDYIIPNTIFSTITINKNFQTAMHKDKKDVGRLGNLIVLHEGKVYGGYILFPQYKIGIKSGDRDFLIMDVHEYHTNTEIKGRGNRFSYVIYLREHLLSP